MTKEIRMIKAPTINGIASLTTVLSFGLRHCFVIRLPRRSLAKAGHSSFVI
jgi:hypothetical protein